MRTISAERPDTEVAVILGVETHLDFHVAVAVDDLGREPGRVQRANDREGLPEAPALGAEFGPVRCAG